MYLKMKNRGCFGLKKEFGGYVRVYVCMWEKGGKNGKC